MTNYQGLTTDIKEYLLIVSIPPPNKKPDYNYNDESSTKTCTESKCYMMAFFTTVRFGWKLKQN